MVLMSQVKSAAPGSTWKTSRMRGFLRKSVPDNAPAGTFNLVFTKAGGSTVTYSVSSAGVITAPSSPLVLDAELLGLLMSSWALVDPDDADAVRAGGGTW